MGPPAQKPLVARCGSAREGGAAEPTGPSAEMPTSVLASLLRAAEAALDASTGPAPAAACKQAIKGPAARKLAKEDAAARKLAKEDTAARKPAGKGPAARKRLVAQLRAEGYGVLGDFGSGGQGTVFE